MIVFDFFIDLIVEFIIGLMIVFGWYILLGDKSVRRDYKGWCFWFYGFGL